MAEDQWEIRRRFGTLTMGREPLQDPEKIRRARKAIDSEYARMKAQHEVCATVSRQQRAAE